MQGIEKFPTPFLDIIQRAYDNDPTKTETDLMVLGTHGNHTIPVGHYLSLDWKLLLSYVKLNAATT